MSRTYKILIVDDNPDHVYSLRKTLQRPEYVFFEAHSGEDALGSVTAHDPDIMLLDVRLPGIDGFEICESIRKISAHLPIVFVTANLKEFVDQVHGFEKGGDDYVIQPYDPRELAIKVKALLRNKVLYDSLLQEVNKLDRMKAEL
ncbi:MAG TPA: response regulator, partial [bacterium]|nr:response regulator [bacterium]